MAIESLLLALLVILAVPYTVWRLGRTDDYAPLVVVQILAGIALGPGLAGRWLPVLHQSIFTPGVIDALGAIAAWAVILFIWIAGIELDLGAAWRERRDSAVTATLALAVPLLTGAAAAWLLVAADPGWLGAEAGIWQFAAGVGMASAVTALPILILFMEKLGIYRTALGQRVLRYGSLDDLAIWGVLALVLLDFERLGRQAAFLLAFAGTTVMIRQMLRRLAEDDRWPVAMIWLTATALGADWAGLHYMVGAFLAGAVLDGRWFPVDKMDLLRHHVLLLLMPVFFLSTGLRTDWQMGGGPVLAAALLLLVAAVGGKFLGVHLAARWLGWRDGEAPLVAWLLQTKALIMIIFANILLDRQVISGDTFTALLLAAVASTMLTVPLAERARRRLTG